MTNHFDSRSRDWRVGLALLSAFVSVLVAGSETSAQQNLFNVPSADVTAPNKVFFQQQFNIAPRLGQSSTTLDYGLGKNWEVGVNLLDVELWNRDDDYASYLQQVTPAILGNVQKRVEIINDVWGLGVGTQVGFGPNRDGSGNPFEQFAWGVNSVQLPGHSQLGRYFLGGYYANEAYGGSGDHTGLLLGAEIPLIENVCVLQADCISANRSISAIVTGAVFFLPSGWQLSTGIQTPTFRSDVPVAAVLEFTHLDLPWFRRRLAK